MTKPRVRLKADGSIMMVGDSLQNLTAGLGTSRDKAALSSYVDVQLSDAELVAAYRGSWLARKIVDIPAFDACRKWRAWQAEADQITLIEAEEKRLDVKRKVMRAKIAARLLGGAALLIGTGDSDTTQPLDPKRVKKGGIKHLTLLQRRHLQAGEIENDAYSPLFDEPRDWTLSTGTTNQPRIHPSRLVFFKGAEMPDQALYTGQAGWGDPVLQSVFEAVRNMDATAGNVASLVFEAKIDTIGVPDFMMHLGSAEYRAKIIERFQLAEIGKGINGTLIHDALETLGQKTTTFAGLPDVLDRFMQMASGAADIPMTRLLGQSPAGLNSTGDGDLRNYYDRVEAIQSLEIAPAMEVFDECLLRSAMGGRPEEIHFTWNSLWQMTAKEKADIGKVQADTAKVVHDIGIIPEEVLADTLVNTLTESGAMPGLEGAMETWLEENPDGLDLDSDSDDGATDPKAAALEGVEPTPAGPAKAKAPVADAAPRSLYISRNVVNAAEILAWAKDQGFTQTLPADELHVTVAYSRTPIDWMKMGEPWDAEKEVAPGGPRLMERFGANGDATVLLFAASSLSWRHEEVIRAGGTHDHGEYQPHITIAYGGAPDLAAITPYRGKIVLGPEIFAEVDENWKAKVLA
jgi:phage-related protein (TIGR01555 family)